MNTASRYRRARQIRKALPKAEHTDYVFPANGRDKPLS